MMKGHPIVLRRWSKELENDRLETSLDHLPQLASAHVDEKRSQQIRRYGDLYGFPDSSPETH